MASSPPAGASEGGLGVVFGGGPSGGVIRQGCSSAEADPGLPAPRRSNSVLFPLENPLPVLGGKPEHATELVVLLDLCPHPRRDRVCDSAAATRHGPISVVVLPRAGAVGVPMFKKESWALLLPASQ